MDAHSTMSCWLDQYACKAPSVIATASSNMAKDERLEMPPTGWQKRRGAPKQDKRRMPTLEQQRWREVAKRAKMDAWCSV